MVVIIVVDYVFGFSFAFSVHALKLEYVNKELINLLLNIVILNFFRVKHNFE